MKKTGFLLLCVLTIAVMFSLTAHADMGPKPSVVIDFNGLDGKTYYATLLASEKTTGPYTALNANKGNAHYVEGDEDYEIFLKFAEYHDAEGYSFLQFFKDCTKTHQFSWTYYPPQVFKILLYFPKTDHFIVSDDRYERYAFDSYFTVQISDTSLSAAKSYDYTNETLSLIVRILLTIAVELAIALLFGFQERKQFRFIILVNVITQIALNLALNIINYCAGELAFVVSYVLLEVGVFIAEAILYTWYLKKRNSKEIPGWKPGVYALVANAASFALGLGLVYWIPGIF
ncbi:hypothetical protein LY28_01132 [Ruminiclostridium sufflavum DSM 19573]|uniref:Uncharacterized protein n=1 Tax=Ruminiclostridium sufflavum DSM 19573 TaxID=1121337 RepID=A0A318XRL6_9FIRM|nr:hypothetical protein [Ruminiclostridium sufflavum]PYG88776.1 hypothetical protein LY28_01132 [Ruminiclostridium sufflavum DSM 19573]